MKEILRKAIETPTFAKEILPMLPLSIFDNVDILKEISQAVTKYYKGTSNMLTEEALTTIVESKLDRMKKSSEVQQEYFNKISELYEIRNSQSNEVIDEEIEKYIKKHLYIEQIKKATLNINNESFMSKIDEEFRNITMLNVLGVEDEIINVIDDTELKRRLLSTLNTNTIPTGFPSIDHLNSGGLAKGELGMILALSGTGKCLEENSIIITEKGMIPIVDIPSHFDVDPVTNESTALVASYRENGEYIKTNTSHWYNLGHSKTIKLTTKGGYEIEGTPEHPLLVMKENGNLEYVELQEMKQGDYISLAKTDMWAKEDKISEEEAYMMGLLVADGYLAQESGKISFSNSEQTLIDYYKEQAHKLWGVERVGTVRKFKGSKTADHNFSNVKLKRELESKGLKMVKSAEKEIPFTVLQSSKKVVRRFVQAMFDTEASVDKVGIELTTASEKMSRQLQTVLLNFGIRASRKVKKVKGYEQNTYYRLTISGLALKVFNKEIGFRFNEKYQEKVSELCEKKTNTNTEVFPHQKDRIKRLRSNYLNKLSIWNGNKQQLDGRSLSTLMHGSYNPSKEVIDYILSYIEMEDEDTKFLKNITSTMMFEPIEKLEDSECVVYDFTVPDTHSFVANGIVSHNTLMLTNLATNYTKRGYNVLFIALEELQNRMVLKFEQSMLRQARSTILSGSNLNTNQFDNNQEFYKKHREIFGNLYFARYSPRTVTPAKIEQLISDVKLRKGQQVDVVIIDYPDLLRNPNATGNESEDGGKLAEEMRRIGQDYNVVMWTASQLNRSAYSARIKTAEHMEGSLRKKNAAELILVVNQWKEEYEAGFLRLYADKVRNPPEGQYDKMLPFKVHGEMQSVLECNAEEKIIHAEILKNVEENADGLFKSKKSQQSNSVPTPNYAEEINKAIRGGS